MTLDPATLLIELPARCKHCKKIASVTAEERMRKRWTCYGCGLINEWVDGQLLRDEKPPKCRSCRKPLKPHTRTESTRVETPNEVASLVEGRPVVDHHHVDRQIQEGWGVCGEGLFCDFKCAYVWARKTIENRRRKR